MPTFQVAYNPTTRIAKIQKDGDAPGSGFTNIGSYDHVTDPDDNLGPDVNHVHWHHVRDLLYKRDPSVQDMQRVEIQYKKLESISSTPATVTLAVAATQQITNAFTPADASNRDVTYSTSDATKATVSASGLITAVATGTATITITGEDGVKDTVVVTIS